MKLSLNPFSSSKTLIKNPSSAISLEQILDKYSALFCREMPCPQQTIQTFLICFEHGTTCCRAQKGMFFSIPISLASLQFYILSPTWSELSPVFAFICLHSLECWCCIKATGLRAHGSLRGGCVCECCMSHALHMPL